MYAGAYSVNCSYYIALIQFICSSVKRLCHDKLNAKTDHLIT